MSENNFAIVPASEVQHIFDIFKNIKDVLLKKFPDVSFCLTFSDDENKVLVIRWADGPTVAEMRSVLDDDYWAFVRYMRQFRSQEVIEKAMDEAEAFFGETDIFYPIDESFFYNFGPNASRLEDVCDFDLVMALDGQEETFRRHFRATYLRRKLDNLKLS